MYTGRECVCPSGTGTDQQAAARRCPPTELIRNGGFEEGGQFTTFRDWEETPEDDTIDIFRNNDIAYEGDYSAAFFAGFSENGIRTRAIRQSVTVFPGCFLSLSFADSFLEAGEDFEVLDVAARVFYTDAGGNRVYLINIEIDYNSEQAGQGFVFHQRVSDTPVPLNVSSVTVEFIVEIESSIGTEWLLDGVSLRAV